MDTLIGLDIGTTKICAVALSAKRGILLATENSLNGAGGSDSSEQQADRIMTRAMELLCRLNQRPELKNCKPLAIGVTGQMHGIVLVDQQGQPLTPLINWQDQGGNKIYETTKRTYAQELIHRLGSEAVERSGCVPATGYGGVTLLRLAEEHMLPSQGIALTIHDMMVRALCGQAATDPTSAASWSLFDVAENRWFPQAAEILRVPRSILPEVLPTGHQAGTLLPDIAAKTGLTAGTPVAVALGDNQASFIGSVPSLPDTLLINLGTGGQMSVPIDHFIRVKGLDTRPLVAGYRLLVGASLCGGRAYQVLERFFRRIGEEVLGIKDVPPLYETMNQLASEASTQCGGIKARTLFAGSRLDPLSRGAFEGLTAENLTPADLTRAVICGMIQELAGFYELAKSAGAHGTRMAGAGNAVRRNRIVRTELESRFAMPLQLPPYHEEAAVGAALTAGKSIGVFRDWESIGKILFKGIKP